ncbi:glutathione S-transferase family protein [Francisellaceae bacterium]|nr:glutathione S-transferase family protein [Francisellaceae bacterium]
MKIYGVSASPFVRKVIVACEVKKLDYTNIPVPPFGEQPEAFKKISPLGKIPVLTDGKTIIPDSSVICAYLEEKYPEISLLPKDISDRARARWLEEYSDSKLIEVVGAKLFFERFAKPKLLGLPTDEKVVEDNLKNTLPPVMDYLNAQVPEEGFLFSKDQLTIPDIAIGSNMVNAKYADYTVDKDKWPKLAAYIERVHNTPAFQKAMALDQKLMGKS